MSLISVIATVYRRRQYLYNALLSLKSQTLPKDKYEVIVVKDFEDPQVDSLIKEMGWRSVYSDEEYQGRMYLNGLKEASGDIVTFLDDDDTYAPNRLEYVYSVFEHNPDVGYLQHSYRLVDTGYRDVPGLAREAPRNLVSQNELKLTWSEVSRYKEYGYPDPILYIFGVFRYYPDRNGTSIAVKRELLGRRTDLLSKLPVNIDGFLFASAIADKSSMFFSDAKLSTYMYNNTNFVSRLQLHDSSPEEVERFLRLHYYYYLSYDLIGRRLLNYYPNYYACLSEKHKLIYLNVARRFGRPITSTAPDADTIAWCCSNGMCLPELSMYLLSPVKQ